MADPRDEELDTEVVELCIDLAMDALNAAEDEDEQELIISGAEARGAEINNRGREAQEQFLRDNSGGW